MTAFLEETDGSLGLVKLEIRHRIYETEYLELLERLRHRVRPRLAAPEILPGGQFSTLGVPSERHMGYLKVRVWALTVHDSLEKSAENHGRNSWMHPRNRYCRRQRPRGAGAKKNGSE